MDYFSWSKYEKIIHITIEINDLLRLYHIYCNTLEIQLSSRCCHLKSMSRNILSGPMEKKLTKNIEDESNKKKVESQQK